MITIHRTISAVRPRGPCEAACELVITAPAAHPVTRTAGLLRMRCKHHVFLSYSARNASAVGMGPPPTHLVPLLHAARFPYLALLSTFPDLAEAAGNELAAVVVLRWQLHGAKPRVNLPERALGDCELDLLSPSEQHSAGASLHTFRGEQLAQRITLRVPTLEKRSCITADVVMVESGALDRAKGADPAAPPPLLSSLYPRPP